MTVDRWVHVARGDLIPSREGRVVTLAGRDIAIFNLGDRFLATDNACPHAGGPLCDGIVAGAAVVCPLHGWKISLTTGAAERPARADRCVATYPVRVEDGILLVGLPKLANDGGAPA